MSQRQHSGSLPTTENVTNLLEAANAAVDRQYEDQEYPYLNNALARLFSSSLEWLHEGIDPREILVDAIQDERSIFDRHNRLQAKSLHRQAKINVLNEELINFPLRNLCSDWMDVLLPAGFPKPIFQVDGDLDSVERTRQARVNATDDGLEAKQPDSPTSSDGSAKHLSDNAGLRLGKVRDAPSPGHNFPDANFTFAEIVAFLPQSIKSWDVADRIIWNGAGAEDIQKMMLKYRDMSYGDIPINSIYMMIRNQMRKRTVSEHGFKHWKDWVVGAQNKVRKPDEYDPDSISVTGFRPSVGFKDRTAEPIPFKSLANGISVWPTDDDALDLTRCVLWCAKHPDEDYYYPTDYYEVLAQLSGPMEAGEGHTDGAALRRIRQGTGRTKARQRTIKNANQDNTVEVEKDSDTEAGKRKRGESSSSTQTKRPRARAAASARNVRATHAPTSSLHLHVDEFEYDSEDEAYRGPKRVRKNKDGPRRSGRKRQQVNYAATEVNHDDEEFANETDDDYGAHDKSFDDEHEAVQAGGDNYDADSDRMDVDD